MKKTFILISLLLPFACFAQSNISERILQYLTDHPVEKVYLQFDKPYYAAGDTIYFKAYITRGGHHRLTDLSEVLHVDLINTSGKIDQSIKLQIDSGITWGDFALPDSLPKGNYRIRAYTRWMRNTGNAYFFDKTIPVGSPKNPKIPESLAKQPDHTNLKPDVQFFPEGGSLVAGIRSKVAVKAIGPNGLGIDVKGTITDDDGKEVASFTSAHLGMGDFYLSPEAGKTYTARITYPDNRQDIFSLPKPEISGITLSVDNDLLPNAMVTINANSEYFKQNRDRDYALIICSQGMVTTVSCKLDSAIVKMNILKRKLHTGVATVRLFSPENEPLCERLFFVQNYDQLNLDVNTSKRAYAKREKVNVAINAANRKGSPAEGHFSVSVIDENKVSGNNDDAANILSYLLLTSDLKGRIEQPDYYFSDTSLMARNNLDILMLTQGYRMFEWKQVLDSAGHPLVYQPEKGIEITGQVKSLFNKPVAQGSIALIALKGGPVF